MKPKVMFDFSSFDRRYLVITAGAGLIVVAAIVVLVVLLTRNDGTQSEGDGGAVVPTSVSSSPSSPLAPTSSLSLEPSRTPTQGPTATLEPHQYTVQAGETLFFIIQLFGYRDTAVVPEILLLNGMASPDDLFEGQVLLIPRQTPTPGPTPSLTATIDPALPTLPPVQATQVAEETGQDFENCTFESPCASPDGAVWIHSVQEGETIAGIAFAYDSSVTAILQENALPNDPIIQIGQIIRVPILISPTPTLTPTGGPDSTATPIPTSSAPRQIAPANGSQVGRSERVVLQWAAIHPLQNNERYLVIVLNLATGEEFRAATHSTIYRLPDQLRPGIGQSIEYAWQVLVIRGENTSVPLPGAGSWQFTWGG